MANAELGYPIALDDEFLKFKRCTFNVKVCGCVNSATTLKNFWQKLVSKGHQLNLIESFLPEPYWIVRMIDGFAICTPITGTASRLRKVMQQLEALLSNNTMENGEKMHNMVEALVTTTDELRIAYELHRLGFWVEFGQKQEADLKINNTAVGIIKAEVKTRINKAYLGGSNKSAIVYERAILSLLCRDAYPKLEEAFDKQDSNIALINLTRSEYGDLVGSYTQLYRNANYFLKSAFDRALIIVKNGEQAVLGYYEIAGGSNGYAAFTQNRNAVQTVGASLDKVETIFRKRGKLLDYYDLARFAQSPEAFLDEVKRSVGK